MPDKEPYTSHTVGQFCDMPQLKVKKTFRLDANLLDELGQFAKAEGFSMTAAIELSILTFLSNKNKSHTQAIREPDESHTQDGVISVLEKQLEVKDRQISDLSEALKQSQELAAAATMLQAAAKHEVQSLPEVSQDWKEKPLFDRIFKR